MNGVSTPAAVQLVHGPELPRGDAEVGRTCAELEHGGQAIELAFLADLLQTVLIDGVEVGHLHQQLRVNSGVVDEESTLQVDAQAVGPLDLDVHDAVGVREVRVELDEPVANPCGGGDVVTVVLVHVHLAGPFHGQLHGRISGVVHFLAFR